MDEIFREFLVTLICVGAVFGVIYTYFITRHRERMTILENGLEFNGFHTQKKNWLTLKAGMFFIGISLGILSANMLVSYHDFSEGVAFHMMLFLFGGLSLIANFLIEKKYHK